jgi:hypothetical protein
MGGVQFSLRAVRCLHAFGFGEKTGAVACLCLTPGYTGDEREQEKHQKDEEQYAGNSRGGFRQPKETKYARDE